MCFTITELLYGYSESAMLAWELDPSTHCCDNASRRTTHPAYLSKAPAEYSCALSPTSHISWATCHPSHKFTNRLSA